MKQGSQLLWIWGEEHSGRWNSAPLNPPKPRDGHMLGIFPGQPGGGCDGTVAGRRLQAASREESRLSTESLLGRGLGASSVLDDTCPYLCRESCHSELFTRNTLKTIHIQEINCIYFRSLVCTTKYYKKVGLFYKSSKKTQLKAFKLFMIYWIFKLKGKWQSYSLD